MPDRFVSRADDLLIQRLTLAAAAAALAAALLGGGHLFAWLTGFMADRGFSTITMKTNTALCLLLAGSALLLLRAQPGKGWRRWGGRACAAVVLFFGAITFGEHLFGWNPGLDQWLAKEPPGAMGVAHPNRMGPPAALSFTLGGAALLLTSWRRVRVAQGLAVAILLIAGLGGIGYLYGVRGLYGLENLTGIAWPTTLGLLLFGFALLAARPAEGLMAQVTAEDPGGVAVRHLFLPALLLPVLLGWLRLTGEARGLYETAMGTSLLVLAFVGVFSLLVFQAGRRLSRSAAATEAVHAALRQNEKRLRATFDNAGVGLVEVDANDRFIAVNDRVCEILRCRREQLVGMRVHDLTVPEDRERSVDRNARLRAGEYERFDYEKRYRRGDGTPLWAHVTVSALRDPAGRFAGSIGTIEDISERKAAEEALRRSEESFREAFTHAPVGMVMNDLQGRFLHVNAAYCQIVGYSEEELLRPDFDFLRLTHPDDLPDNLEQISRMLRGEAPAFFVEKRYLHKDGHTVWVRVSGSVRRDEADRPFQLVSLIEDITARKETEAALQKAMQAKSDFLANMSHEIRTPMTVFLGALEFLLEMDHKHECREVLELADKSAQRLRALIDDILDFSRIEAGRLDIRDEPFDLRDCLHSTVDLLAATARKKGLRLQTTVAADVPPRVRGDADRLAQVLLNLVGNAVKFTDAGEVQVVAAVAAGRLHFTVSDTGIGVPEEKRGILFDSFSQVDSSHTRRHGGTGLGLAISKGLVDMMGGEIGMDSREGGGSVFFFSLPLHLPEATAVPPPEAASAAAAAPTMGELASARILLAEDDPAIRMMIRTILAPRGWEMEDADTGREAVEKWAAGDIDVVLMDLQMPEMDGLEAAGRIRELEDAEGRRTCIIGLSAHAHRDIKEQCLAAGMDAYLTKPVRRGDLFSAIEGCLNG